MLFTLGIHRVLLSPKISISLVLVFCLSGPFWKIPSMHFWFASLIVLYTMASQSIFGSPGSDDNVPLNAD